MGLVSVNEVDCIFRVSTEGKNYIALSSTANINTLYILKDINFQYIVS